MSEVTNIGDVQDQVQKVWSPVFMDEWKEKGMLSALVNRDYEGSIGMAGDTVYVSQINVPEAQRRTVGENHTKFTTTQLVTERIGIVADQVFSAAFEFDSLVQLQSQLGQQDSKIRAALLKALDININDYLYSLVSPSTSNPDHSIASVTDFNDAQILGNRMLASQSYWPDEDRWILADPSYYNDLLNSATLTSADYATDMPKLSGKLAVKRFGFNIVEDNSAGARRLSPTNALADRALTFHKDFMHLAVQLQPTFEISSKHSAREFGYIISVRLVGGAKLGLDGATRHIVTYNS